MDYSLTGSLGIKKMVTGKLGSILASPTDFLDKSGCTAPGWAVFTHLTGGIHPSNSKHLISMPILKAQASVTTSGVST